MARLNPTTGCTDSQEAFARFYVTLNNGTEAYLKAYPECLGRASAAACASKYLKSPKIAKLIESIRANIQHKANLRVLVSRSPELEALAAEANMQHIIASTLPTINEHSDRLKELALKAEEDGKWTAAISAEVKRGELAGYYVNRNVNENVNRAASDLTDAELADIATGSSAGADQTPVGSHQSH